MTLYGQATIPASEQQGVRPFYPALDGLRGIAVLMVFHQHYLKALTGFGWGWAGVDVFFVLSGFLITGILYDSRDVAHRLKRFYLRRALRIFPLYYGVLAAGALLAPLLHWIWHPAWLLWPLYLGNCVRFVWIDDPLLAAGALEHMRSALDTPQTLFLYFGHFWSLCVEEQFYLVWPLVVFTVQSRERLRNLCFALCAAALSARIACVALLPASYLNAELLYRITPLRADALLIGAALALMLRGPEADRLRAWAKPCLVVLIASVAGVSLAGISVASTTDPFVSTIGFTLIDFGVAVMILRSLHVASALHRLMTLGPLTSLGRISYGFYVFHDIPHVFYRLFAYGVLAPLTGAAPSLLTGILAFFGTLTLAALSYRFIERPILRWKDKVPMESSAWIVGWRSGRTPSEAATGLTSSVVTEPA